MRNSIKIQAKLAEIAARSAAVQQKRTSTASNTVNIHQELDKARAIDAEADIADAQIQPLLREEARAHHARAQDEAAQHLFETLADEILERYEQTLKMQLMIYDRGGDDIERLLQMSDERWQWFLHDKRLKFGSKLVAQATEFAEL